VCGCVFPACVCLCMHVLCVIGEREREVPRWCGVPMLFREREEPRNV